MFTRLDKHEVLVEEWSEDVVWLWSMCQPIPNKPHIQQWHELINRIRTRKVRRDNGVGIDETLEDTVIEVGALDGDGEDASNEMVNENKVHEDTVNEVGALDVDGEDASDEMVNGNEVH
ncbi:hypothetical protein PGT21_036409 [Puccinia graminis f. sp. tritici]|uniref:Uncharacterized protein n=1 Tax=Puccinia graminis f. sp. tritici TaxID=56615 RepID=A0A5B0R303_PUCGR|nr:hypothetical protein PGT21_036409 [Puccinia graminis f. sp. tritici]